MPRAVLIGRFLMMWPTKVLPMLILTLSELTLMTALTLAWAKLLLVDSGETTLLGRVVPTAMMLLKGVWTAAPLSRICVRLSDRWVMLIVCLAVVSRVCSRLIRAWVRLSVIVEASPCMASLLRCPRLVLVRCNRVWIVLSRVLVRCIRVLLSVNRVCVALLIRAVSIRFL